MVRRRHLVALSVALGLSLSAAGVARAAAPGSLDPSFGTGGVVALASGTQLFGVAVQSGGQVVVAGQTGGSVLVERFTTGGASAGTYIGPPGYARGVAIQSNGDIVFAGTNGAALFVERLTPSLTPDPTFGSGGIATALSGAVANAVAVAPNGDIVAAGSDNGQVAVAQFSATGTTLWSEALNFGNNSLASGVAVQPADDKIVLVGEQRPLQLTNGVIARLNSDGTLDGSFAGGGATTFHYPGGGYTTLTAVALQNNGDIVVAGAEAGGPNALLLRYTPSGTLDPSFGSGGVTALLSGQQISVPGTPIGAYGVGIGGGGAIIGAGMFQIGGGEFDGALWATTSAGAPQASFGTGGTARNPTGAYEECALAVAPDGSLVAVGSTVAAAAYSTPCSVNTGSAGFVARYIGFGPPPPAVAPAAAPTVSTGSASGVSQLSATITGAVNPNGLATTYSFQYGTSTSYGSTGVTAGAGAGSAQVPVAAALTGLRPGTTYHYRLVATSSAGTTSGADATFTTAPPGPPTATTGAAGVTEISATASGTLGTGALTTTYQIDYGRTSAYGSASAAVTAAPSSDLAKVSVVLKGLSPATTYHYRLIAQNALGTARGLDKTFTTEPRLKATLHGVAGSYRTSTLARKGLAIKIGCNQACSLKTTLLISASEAKAIKLGRHGLGVASRSASLARAGTARLALALTRAAKHALAGHSISVTLRIIAAPVGGGRSVTLTRTLRFAA